uniref:aryl hydrocarbon receptor nuclear translocator-like 1b isoform X2 n=1 Tax=Scatophagus argus TaxID=75038 RepID=UPI001ED843B0|nr:aryl hydrocarbon receptor nuclear translocator-like 1b isoform X2 [Scatophagus argus]
MTSKFASQSTILISTSAGKNSKKLSLKRKGSSAVYLDCDDLQGYSMKSRRTHSQIEKRRRDKMNSFIDELASLLPTCNTKSGKLDKLSVLRMAVQHMKTIRGSSGNQYAEFKYKNVVLSDEELKHLLQREADGFLFVVNCDQGKILFVSESVYKILHYSQRDLIGQSLFDCLHPNDIVKVKEQLSSAVIVPREKSIDAKSPSVKTDINPSSVRLCSGMRRSFFCRMKCNRNVEDEDFSLRCSGKKNDHKGFCTIHSTGYIKRWRPTEVDLGENNELHHDGRSLGYLVAVGRLQLHTVSQPVHKHIKVRPMEFVSRHAIDGKFVFVDQRVTAILAYLPQELLGTSFYEYFHEDDIAHLAECHRQVLQLREKINTNCYKLKINDGPFIKVRSCWFSYANPWTKEVEYIVSVNTVVTPSVARPENSYHLSAASLPTVTTVLMPGERKLGPRTVPGIPGGTRAGAGKIGQKTVEEIQGVSFF